MRISCEFSGREYPLLCDWYLDSQVLVAGQAGLPLVRHQEQKLTWRPRICLLLNKLHLISSKQLNPSSKRICRSSGYARAPTGMAGPLTRSCGRQFNCCVVLPMILTKGNQGSAILTLIPEGPGFKLPKTRGLNMIEMVTCFLSLFL